MTSAFGSLFDLAPSTYWLVAANVVLAATLALWIWRYRRLQATSRLEQQYNSDLIENLSEGIYRSSPDGKQLSANKALVKLNGYDNEPEMLAAVLDIGKEWYVEPRRRDEFRAILMRDGKVEGFVSEIYRHKTRERIWITESARLVCSPTGRPLFYEGSVREITETVERLRLEERFRKLTSQLPGGLFQFVRRADDTYAVAYLSAGWERVTGLSIADEMAGKGQFTASVLDEDKPAFFQSLLTSAERLEYWDHEFRFRTPEGVEKWLRVTAQPEFSNGDVTWHGYTSDISTRKKQEMEIRELAYFDTLTKLPNRRMFLNRMAQATEACERHGDHGALLFIDLDNFKTLNDTQGHDVGDEFLVEVANRLRRCVNPRDLVARIGGDEFVVVIEQSGPDAAHGTLRAITGANQILSALRQEFILRETRHIASASVGIVVFDGSEKRTDEILKRADLAMYQAKASGRNGMALFDAASMDKESARYRLLGDLRSAFDKKQLELHFQPQVDDRGRVCGAEALVRWSHPTFGVIPPDQFIPLAEQFGLAADLTSFVFDEGMRTLQRWQADDATAGLRLALNVGVNCFAGDDFIPMVERLIRTYGVDAGKLTLELTEHVMARDHEHIAVRMAEAKRLGVRLSLDDFGTGYSSLAYLKQLPFDEVKIDGSFVADIETAESDRALVKTILAMARTLGLTAVAEHVENVRQEAFLRTFGCDFFQGFLYSRAVPAERFLHFVRQHNVLETPPAGLRQPA
jgi:diguanylate cyclase (GGDEF)-like protein/PAS domain S-box-containing protein